METYNKSVTPAFRENASALPNVYSAPRYVRKSHIDIQGDYGYIKSKIEKYAKENNFFPGFKIKFLDNDMYDLSEIKQSSEPQYFVAKWIDFRSDKDGEEHASFELTHFYLLITSAKTQFAKMKISSADLHQDTKVHIHFQLKRDPSATDKNNVKYSYKVEVINCSRRNAALQLLEIFMAVGDQHLNDIADKFRTKISKWADKISDIFKPNGSPDVISKFDHKIQSLSMIKQQIENFYESFIKPDNIDEIKFLPYKLPDGLRLFKQADQCGKGFSFRADVEILRSVFLQFGAYMDFIKKSVSNDDQFYSPFIPKGEKFLILKDVQQNWHNDEYFCHELFNGCNPFTIAVANPETLRPEFHQIKDEAGNHVDLRAFPHGDLFISRYPETRPFAHPNSPLPAQRGIYFLEPEVLTAIVDGKFKIIGIGFYFGKDATEFEVFTPTGTWRDMKTPPNIFMLAKMHVMAADSNTHEILKHLGMSHMIGETFAMAHHNTYHFLGSKSKHATDNHAIGAMLLPHFTNLLAINNLARVTLIAPINNQLSNFQGVRGEDFGELIARWYTQKEDLWNTDVGFYEELNQRGFDPATFRHGDKYRFLKDGKRIYDEIVVYVDKVIRQQFTEDSVKNDKLLKAFFNYIANPQYGDIKGFPKAPETLEQVIEVFSKIIWQVSGYHSALNFSQVQSYGYSLMRAPGLRQDLKKLSTYRHDLAKKNKAFLTEDDVSNLYVQETIPTNDMIFGMTEVANVLTTRTVQTFINWSSPFSRLEHNEKNLKSQDAFNVFMDKMAVLEKDIEKDNATAQFRYIHLQPSKVDISISI
eukprot:403354533